jgi:hypothetical protein
MVERWRTYARLVQKTYFLATPDMYQRAATIKMLQEHFGKRNWRRWNGEVLGKAWVGEPAAFSQIIAYLKVSGALLDEKSAITDDVLHDHPAGFSTRPADIIHDLLPF